MNKRTDSGNGAYCPINPKATYDGGHGRMLVISPGVQYCPHQDHDRTRTPALYKEDGKTPLPR